MLLSVHPDIQELQSKLKEILYDCAVEVRATKAALYLFDQTDSRYELVTEYGFRGALRTTADKNDPVVDRCGRGRTAFFVNGLMAEPRFSEILYESSTDRMLIAPIYLRGQLVGFVDMRDKAAKQPFETSDLPKGAKIADRVGELFASNNVFGLRYIAVSAASATEPALTGVYSAAAVPGGLSGSTATAAAPAPAPKPVSGAFPKVAPAPGLAPAPAPFAAPPLAAPVAAPLPAGRVVPKIAALIAHAQGAAEVLKAPATETLSESDLAIARDILKLILLIPGVTAAAFSTAQLGGVQEILGKSAIGDDAITALKGRIDAWLQKRGETATFPKLSFSGTGDIPITPADLQKVFTAPLNAGSLKGLYLTVAFKDDPERAAHDLLAALHRQLQTAIEQSVQRRTNDLTRRRIAEKLLEPEFTQFPELRRHTEAVVRRVDAFAKYLALSPAEIENARLVGIVHDIGMRLIDYDRLYRKRDLSHDEKELMQSHALIGAALVEPFLGRDVARAVLSHHERWDGGGYPNDIRGAEIPLLSRVLQICDVYESMVSADNYQTPQSHDAAMTVIGRGAGIQFDPDLAGRFAEMMRSS
jgi:hypothetical protein